MADKKIVPYKSQFVYDTSDNRAVDVKVDFDPQGDRPVIIVELSGEVSKEDLNIIMMSVGKNMEYRMGFDIFSGAVIKIMAGGAEKEYDRMEKL